MNKKEIKKLLKARNKLAEARERFENDIKDETLSFDIYSVYQESLKDICKSLKIIDEKFLSWCQESPVGEWLLQINGLTADLATGLLVYFDVTDKECAAQFISYSGLDGANEQHSDVSGVLHKIKENMKTNPNSHYKRIYENKFFQLINDGIERDTAKIRANRFAMKVFVAHLFEEMYREEHNGMLPKRYGTDGTIIEPEVPYTKQVEI